ncbi:hypothetical protein LH128_05273 [Sphingomonas sp. LH128]|uniref:hypothetical protein n=1 Tax=Sphingomonas sp. LH128 TaxID=473781 RepID=UPI00027C9B2A|nr:hypothetical protein [Sphingomonas sp. LH128]EJU14143.1 hypothetical protein LH128_05273 [Sphingomonas sp. LH128]
MDEVDQIISVLTQEQKAVFLAGHLYDLPRGLTKIAHIDEKGWSTRVLTEKGEQVLVRLKAQEK